MPCSQLCDGQQAPLTSLAAPSLDAGPIYHLPGTFAKASVVSKHPTWGRVAGNSLKSGRFRADEVRFCSNSHQRELLGHFSPGPQYKVPSAIGGACGNCAAHHERLFRMLPRGAPLCIPMIPYRNAAAAASTQGRMSLDSLGNGAMDIEGAPLRDDGHTLITTRTSPTMTTRNSAMIPTPGSFADAARSGGMAPAMRSTEFWRGATMLQPQEPNFHKSGPFPERPQPWIATAAQLANSTIQDGIKRNLSLRSRPEPKTPRRQVSDRMADPVLANIFGGGVARDDFGQRGGINSKWQTSVVSGHHTAAAPKLGDGKPPSSGPLRFAFVQKSGLNAIPRGSSKADFDGTRLHATLKAGALV